VSKEFYSFDRVLRELQMQEEELKRLVSEGEIRAFRDQDKMKFKAEDVERFKKVRSSADAETLGDEDIPEELVFDEDDADQEVGMATAAISDDSFLEEDEGALELEAELPPEPRAKRGRATAGAARKPRVVVEEPEEAEGPLWTTAIVLTTIACLLGVLVVLDAQRGLASGLTSGLANLVKSWFLS